MKDEKLKGQGRTGTGAQMTRMRSESREPVRLEQRLGPGHVLVVRVRHDRNYLGNPNGLRKGEMHQVRRTRLMYLVKRRWHIADDFEVIGRHDV